MGAPETNTDRSSEVKQYAKLGQLVYEAVRRFDYVKIGLDKSVFNEGGTVKLHFTIIRKGQPHTHVEAMPLNQLARLMDDPKTVVDAIYGRVIQDASKREHHR